MFAQGALLAAAFFSFLLLFLPTLDACIFCLLCIFLCFFFFLLFFGVDFFCFFFFLIYIGAIAVLFIFVIMYLPRRRRGFSSFFYLVFFLLLCIGVFGYYFFRLQYSYLFYISMCDVFFPQLSMSIFSDSLLVRIGLFLFYEAPLFIVGIGQALLSTTIGIILLIDRQSGYFFSTFSVATTRLPFVYIL